jgi:hypothetical protein
MSARGVPVFAGRREDNRGMARRVAPSPPGLPRPLVGGLLGVRFVSELALLAAAAWAAGSHVSSTPVAALLGVVAALVVATVWSFWVAPASRRRLADPLRLGVEVVLFTAVAAALLGVHRVLPAVLLAVVGLGAAVAVRALPSSHGA